jgi:WD40 repeat protein
LGSSKGPPHSKGSLGKLVALIVGTEGIVGIAANLIAIKFQQDVNPPVVLAILVLLIVILILFLREILRGTNSDFWDASLMVTAGICCSLIANWVYQIALGRILTLLTTLIVVGVSIVGLFIKTQLEVGTSPGIAAGGKKVILWSSRRPWYLQIWIDLVIGVVGSLGFLTVATMVQLLLHAQMGLGFLFVAGMILGLVTPFVSGRKGLDALIPAGISSIIYSIFLNLFQFTPVWLLTPSVILGAMAYVVLARGHAVIRSQNPTSADNLRVARRTFLVGFAGIVVGGGAVAVSVATHANWQSLLPDPLYVYTYRGHKGGISSVTWSPDGKRIASAGVDATVQVWDATTGNHVLIYRGHSDWVTEVTWSLNGKYIASASGAIGSSNQVEVWDAVTGSHIVTYPGTWASWSPDSKHLAVEGVEDGKVQIWNIVSGYSRSEPFSAGPWSPNGKYIASAEASKVNVWDVASGKLVSIYRGHYSTVNNLAWSSDSKYIASASGDLRSPRDRTVHICEALTGKHVYTYQGHSDIVNSVMWSPDDRRIVSGSHDTTAQVWEAFIGKLIYTYRSRSFFGNGSVEAASWSPNGKYLATGFWGGTVQVWRAP